MKKQHRARRWAAPAAVLAVVVPMGCGDDEDSADTARFCDGFLGIERAFAEMPEDESALPDFIDERIEPNLEAIDGAEPDAIADEVAVLTSAVRDVVDSGDFAPFSTPEFSDASQAVYSSLDEHCDVEVVEFDAIDFDYVGVPDTLSPGPTAFVMANESEAGEAHEFSLVRLRDDTDLSVEDLLSMPESEANEHIDTFAGGLFGPAGATAGTVVELTPGRWAYVCFVPVGSVHGEDGSGPPHFTAGMAGEFRVEDEA